MTADELTTGTNTLAVPAPKPELKPKSGPETVVLLFGPGALRRLQDGTKRAAVVPAKQVGSLKVGSSLTAKSVFGDARLPLQVRARHDLPGGIDGLPALAETAGLTLADFTVETEWSGYLTTARQNVPKAAVVLVVDPAGPMTGTLYDKKKKKKTSGSGPWAWYRVDLQLQPVADAQIHPADRKPLATRIRTVCDRLAPEAQMREAVDAVAEVLLGSHRAHGTITRELRARIGSAQTDAAVAWLRRNKLLVGLGAERVWSPRLLVGLRIQMPASLAGDRTPEPDTADVAGAVAGVR
ncbi:hypothetical protein [Pseudonocardia sp. ICBG1293]|uniref:hypothetical protein n=1 Tax=Pseudonocardia sp. ICBG1293 TaxID=2844382 RepID=UPI001CCF5246|nr:hypothetical protein [Pseudonocardia sp. ICBG1293]